MIQVGIAGVSGYTGNTLLKLLLHHSQVNIKYLAAERSAGLNILELDPSFINFPQLPTICKLDEVDFETLDCFFTATPNGISSSIAQKALNANCKLIDLAADFRLKNKNIFEDWYSPLSSPEESLLAQAVYGLTEYNRKEIKQAKLLANPGCYPTATSLGVIPLFKERLASEELCIIDAKSGATGAGKSLSEGLLFAEIEGSFKAYKVDKHRHTPEIEQNLDLFAQTKMHIRFTPHLLPMKRGILATCYLKPVSKITNKDLQECFEENYRNETFVKVVNRPPETKDTYGSNRCHIWSHYDDRSDMIIVLSAIDNLMKGAAGQAVQNFNLMFGFEESLALS
ncbi:MAG TPA: N-acetyl-gamma-glutamyl-phosphate reductase [Vampirovibrionales bacterium]